ncbi:MAG: site-specific integrase [Flavobacteriaceae bacterium]|nr:site-specific integrase [Flavobacteriaceae bacterium]
MEIEHCNKNRFDLWRSKELIKDGLPAPQGESLFGYLDEIIQEREDRGMSQDSFIRLKKELSYYTSDIGLREIDYNWVRQFITYKKKSGTGEGGISHYIRTASTVFNEAVRRGYVDTNPFTGHRIKRKRTTPLVLPTFEEVRMLASFEGYGNKAQQANLKKVAQTFIFQIHIGGHYLSDLGQLSESNIKNGRIKFQRYKNRSKEGGGETVDNMLTDFALEYLKTYGFWFKHPSNPGFKNFRDGYNTTLRRIGKKLEIESGLRSAMPRYIFKTASEECRARRSVTKKLMGHANEDVDEGYIGRLSYELIDEEHRRILAALFES